MRPASQAWCEMKAPSSATASAAEGLRQIPPVAGQTHALTTPVSEGKGRGGSSSGSCGAHPANPASSDGNPISRSRGIHPRPNRVGGPSRSSPSSSRGWGVSSLILSLSKEGWWRGKSSPAGGGGPSERWWRGTRGKSRPSPLILSLSKDPSNALASESRAADGRGSAGWDMVHPQGWSNRTGAHTRAGVNRDIYGRWGYVGKHSK